MRSWGSPRAVVCAGASSAVLMTVAVIVAPLSLATGLAGPALAGPSVEIDRRFADQRIVESSGLTTSERFPGVVYTVNDSGNEPVIFAVGADGRTAATFRVEGVAGQDWEALASGTRADGSPVLWVGDIGDNDAAREAVEVVLVDEPDTLENAVVTGTPYTLAYEDGPRDAEALLVDPDTQELFVVTKDKGLGAVYAPPARLQEGAVNIMRRVSDAPRFITDGAMTVDPVSPTRQRIVLINYGSVFLADSLEGPYVQVPAPPRPQGETVTWLNGSSASTILLGSEGAYSELLSMDVPRDERTPEPVPTGSPLPSAEPTESPTIPPADSGVAFAPVLILAVVVLGGGIAAGAMVRRKRTD